jgi:hypothetical protein
MLEYRRKDLDLSTRIEIGLEMLRPAQERGWGRASELAREHNISRGFLYVLKDRIKQALEKAMRPRQVGRPTEEKMICVNQDYLRRAIAIMPLLTGTVRSIQTGLELLFDTKRSIGYISETLQLAGKAAQSKNESMVVPLPILGEADEIFAGRKPCLTVVDGRSFLVLNLAAAESRDATNWGMTFLELEEQGFVFQDVAADGARGIRAGLRDAEVSVPLRPDLFHLLQEGKRLQNRLEKAAYKAIRLAEKAKRAEQEANQPQKRCGRPLEVDVSAKEAAKKQDQAISSYDDFCWLLDQIRQNLEPVRKSHHLRAPSQARRTITAAVELLQTLPDEDVAGFAQTLNDHLDELLAPLIWLHNTLTPWQKLLSKEEEAWIIAAWQSGLSRLKDFPPAWHKIVAAFWHALDLFHRSSSIAESLHSWVRPFLTIHRVIPTWLLSLLQLFWNHHVFSRGKRAGSSPLQLAGVEDAPSLASVFDTLFAEPATT